eukprot:TRINITY_DN1554_c0_g2_i2.p2 TRINITY_DN1554_c0_g2~~TRINITY_DN1554_c0_g2_i2.p2  ORF type:complete len:472 (-),score=150.94 TRINITY_DN1554_c0_g2_i2:1770-3107(-)
MESTESNPEPEKHTVAIAATAEEKPATATAATATATTTATTATAAEVKPDPVVATAVEAHASTTVIAKQEETKQEETKQEGAKQESENEDAADEEEEEEGSITYETLASLTVVQLRQKLRAIDRPATGRKEDLIKTLLANADHVRALEATEAKAAAVTTTPSTRAKRRIADEKPEEPAAKRQKTEKADKVEECSPTKEPAATPTPTASPTATVALVTMPGTDLDFFPEGVWRQLLQKEFGKPYFRTLMAFVAKERQSREIFPPSKFVWSAFEYTPFDTLKVVIIGQDPYFNPGQAHGLCFSVQKGVKVPPSLNRIYNELKRSIPGFVVPKHGCLDKWARQGVFLLNASLTVQSGTANSHSKSGWQEFTDAVVKLINEKKKNVVYLLWGQFAQKKGKVVSKTDNFVLEAPHPSPMSKGFDGCNHFVKTNELLKRIGQAPIDWSIDP